MKKLLLLSIVMLLFASCEKEENQSNCSVCTVMTSNSLDGESTDIYEQSEVGDCDETQDEFKEQMNVRHDALDLMVLTGNLGTGLNTTQTHTITCQYD
jgi:amino acid permease